MRSATLCLLLLALTLLPACARLRGSAWGFGGGAQSDLEFRSLQTSAALKPGLRTACYKPVDATSADLYLSDLPESRLADPDDDLAGAAGSILHIHFFIEPSPGNTPIDDTACNATIRHVIIAPATTDNPGRAAQVIGVYGGGGFFYPAGEIGDDTFGGAMRAGTHRLISATPGFKDLLGPSSIDGSVRAGRDDALADDLAARIDALIRHAAE